MQWPMGNQNRKSKKNRQDNGQWGIRTVNQRRTDNTMANGESEPWPLYCLFFFDWRFWFPIGHCIVCSSLIYDSDSPLAIVLSVLLWFTVLIPSKKNRQYNGQWGIRTVNQRRTDNTMADDCLGPLIERLPRRLFRSIDGEAAMTIV
jgi:hypothetical protein